VVLWANYVRLVPSLDLVLYRYDVAVQPTVAGKKLVQVIRLLLEVPELQALKHDVVTDFKSTLISRSRLPMDDKTYEVQYRAEGEDDPLPDAVKYKIRLLYTNTLSVSELVKYLTSTNVNDSLDDTQNLVQAFNIFLNHYAKSADNLATIGSTKTFSLASNSNNTWDLGSGLTAIRGFFSSVRVAAARILVNVQVSHGAFFNEGPLQNLMYEYLNTHHNSKFALGKFLNKLRVRATHLSPKKNKKGEAIHRARGIFGLANKNDGHGLDKPPRVKEYGAGAKDVEFWLDGAPNTSSQSGKGEGKKGKGKGGAAAKAPAAGGRYITVFDFFKTAHNITLKHPQLPVVNTGNREKPTYLPAELCIVLPGQNSKSKLDPSQTQKMIKGAVRQPWQNATSIVNEGLQSVGLDARTNKLLSQFNLTITPTLITVPGRILPEPKINYKANKSANPVRGSWNMNDIRFNTAATVKSWSYVLISTPGSYDAFQDPQSLAFVMQGFHAKLQRMGLSVPVPLPGKRLVLSGPDDPQLGKTIQGAAEKGLDLLFFILSDANTPVYYRIKRDADIRYGIHSICSVGSKLSKPNGQDQYFANLALKFNLKLGGINQMVDTARLGIINGDKTMIVGIDVTHPSPGSSSNAPSVAGMVASVDRYLGQWPATLRIQAARQEHVADLTSMLSSRLQLWKTKGKHSSFPENILIYRDGVSEGQYNTVLDTELPLLRKAAQQLYPAVDQKKGLPKFTIIIAGKRHKTRFYPTTAADADQKSANSKPGTVVDRGVTEPRTWDFFLQAHAALQGTARPCHYIVILDEIFRSAPKNAGAVPAGCQNTADVLEDLTHSLCYLFGRATKAVSLCPPAYYADIVCERARHYLVDVFESPVQSVAASSVAEGGKGGAGQVGNEEILVHQRLRDSMFYL
jgi:hypothetical protein